MAKAGIPFKNPDEEYRLLYRSGFAIIYIFSIVFVIYNILRPSYSLGIMKYKSVFVYNQIVYLIMGVPFSLYAFHKIAIVLGSFRIYWNGQTYTINKTMELLKKLVNIKLITSSVINIFRIIYYSIIFFMFCISIGFIFSNNYNYAIPGILQSFIFIAFFTAVIWMIGDSIENDIQKVFGQILTTNPSIDDYNELISLVFNKESPLFLPSIKKAVLSDSLVIGIIQILIAVGGYFVPI